MKNISLPPMIWTDPEPLASYRKCPLGSGLYVIGKARDEIKDIYPDAEYDGYIGTWPSNFAGLYVGISTRKPYGIRSRLSCHARGKGNKKIKDDISNGVDMHYIIINGDGAINYEYLFIALLAKLCPYNSRDETKRYIKRNWDSL